MNRFLSLLLLVGSYSFLVPSASAFQKDAELAYMISFKEPAAHFAEVQLKLVSLDSARTTLVLPVWTPGYYKILDNPAHIIDFKVSTISGEPLQWHKIAKTNGYWKMDKMPKSLWITGFTPTENRWQNQIFPKKKHLWPTPISSCFRKGIWINR